MENIVDHFIRILEQTRILHWQTKSFARHKAYGDFYDSLSDSVDEFIETHMGKYGRVITGGSIELKNTNEIKIVEFIREIEEFLLSLNEHCDSASDSDLLNIRDEMLGHTNKLKYLLTLE